ncbi:hypothetical protein MBELCI_0719 [Limimaricola cinnabarinus LL-001]|uniref:Uncharacterized protein n=1 Tax=Limimaricola cinnabarinus LL-001 TaxID=1337093 RepID=U2Z0P4_9RHOB|nr:hypothetical protein MBELCI_0719 [Limimaricola cinnabarinus LL-001]
MQYLCHAATIGAAGRQVNPPVPRPPGCRRANIHYGPRKHREPP